MIFEGSWLSCFNVLYFFSSLKSTFFYTINYENMKESAGKRSGSCGGSGTTGEKSSWRVAMEPLERESGPKGGYGATRKRSGCMVIVEPGERDQVVWWLWNHESSVICEKLCVEGATSTWAFSRYRNPFVCTKLRFYIFFPLCFL